MIDCCLENRVCNFKKNIFIKMIKRCINKKIKFRLKKYILSTYFKCLEFKKKSLFLFKSWIFFIYILKFLMILRFYDPFLRSEFVNGFPCRVKIAILTTLVTSNRENRGKLAPKWDGIFKVLRVIKATTCHLQDMEGNNLPYGWHSDHLKMYHSEWEFIFSYISIFIFFYQCVYPSKS